MPVVVTGMDLEIIIVSEMSKGERQILYDITYMWKLKSDSTELIFKTETDSQA